MFFFCQIKFIIIFILLFAAGNIWVRPSLAPPPGGPLGGPPDQRRGGGGGRAADDHPGAGGAARRGGGAHRQVLLARTFPANGRRTRQKNE